MNDAGKAAASDIPVGSWIDRHAPAWARPYLRLMRLDRPIGTWLLLFPCWWSVALASPALPDLHAMALFAVGALIMRGAGCTVNDIADRNFDAQVARTADRPIASGQITVFRAIVFLGLELLAGLVVLLQFNRTTVELGILSLALVAIYPFSKRVTYWPQAILGLTFNWGALIGWTAVRGTLDAPALVLYAACFFWTMGYDTIYAHQDKEDDILIGVKSTALKLGENTRPWLFVFYGLTVLLTGIAGWLAALAWPFYVGLALVAAHLLRQAAKVDIGNPHQCLATFKSNRTVGWLLLGALIAGRAVTG